MIKTQEILYKVGDEIVFNWNNYCKYTKALTPSGKVLWPGYTKGAVTRITRYGKVIVAWEDGTTTTSSQAFLTRFKLKTKKTKG